MRVQRLPSSSFSHTVLRQRWIFFYYLIWLISLLVLQLWPVGVVCGMRFSLFNVAIFCQQLRIVTLLYEKSLHNESEFVKRWNRRENDFAKIGWQIITTIRGNEIKHNCLRSEKQKNARAHHRLVSFWLNFFDSYYSQSDQIRTCLGAYANLIMCSKQKPHLARNFSWTKCYGVFCIVSVLFSLLSIYNSAFAAHKFQIHVHRHLWTLVFELDYFGNFCVCLFVFFGVSNLTVYLKIFTEFLALELNKKHHSYACKCAPSVGWLLFVFFDETVTEERLETICPTKLKLIKSVCAHK